MKYAHTVSILAVYIGCASLVSSTPILSTPVKNQLSERGISSDSIPSQAFETGRISPITDDISSTKPEIPVRGGVPSQGLADDAEGSSIFKKLRSFRGKGPKKGVDEDKGVNKGEREGEDEISSFIAQYPQNPSEDDGRYVLRVLDKYTDHLGEQNRFPNLNPYKILYPRIFCLAFILSQPQNPGESATAYARRMMIVHLQHLLAAHKPSKGLADNENPLFLSHVWPENYEGYGIRVLETYFSKPPAVYTTVYFGIFKGYRLNDFVRQHPKTDNEYYEEYGRRLIALLATQYLNPQIALPASTGKYGLPF